MISIRSIAATAAVLALSAAPALAQASKPVQPDQARELRAKLELLRAQQAEIEAQLKKHGVELDLKRTIELSADKAKLAQLEFEKALQLDREKLTRAREEFEKALDLKVGQVKLARVKEEIEKALDLRVGQDKLTRVKEEIEKAAKLQDGKLKIEILDKIAPYIEGQDKPKVVVLQGGKVPGGYEQMTPQQLKELIVKLTQILEEKTRGGDKAKPGTGDKPKPLGEKVKPATGDKPKPATGEKVKPGGVANEELMRRLEKLTFEIEELKRAIKK